MNKWYRLGDFVSKSLKGITPKYVEESDIIVLNQKCIRNNRIDYSFSRYHDSRKRFSQEKIVRKGDLLFNSTGQGTAGRCCFIRDLPEDKTLITDSHILILRIKDFYLAESFSYALYKEEALIQSFMDGSTGQGELDKVRLFNVQFRLPEKRNRKHICDFLGYLNEKIEINNKINKELEAIAKSIYDYWFVQYDFPTSKEYAASIGKPELAGKPYKTSKGEMVYNEQIRREIPQGWEDKELKDFAKTGSGGTPLKSKKEYYLNGNIPWINSGEVNEPFIVSARKFLTEEGLKNSSAKICDKGTILMAMYGATAGKVSFMDLEACTNQAICTINPQDDRLRTFLKFALEDMYEYLINLSSGSARDNLSQDKIKNLSFVIPEDNIIEKYDQLVNPMMLKILINLKQNHELGGLRDCLLPMLMNGQVTIKESYDEIDEQIDMAAEVETAYQRNSEFVDSLLFEQVNLYKEIAAIQLIEEETIGITHGKTGIQKTASNLQQIFKEKRLRHVEFEERPWGMFSDTIAQNIETNPFLFKHELDSGKKVYRVKPEAKKKLQTWIKLEENQDYVQTLNSLLTIYQEPFIKNDIYKIELLNTVYRCMSKLHTDNLDTIRTAMHNWPMIERKYKNKAEKFSERVTAKMIDFIKDKQLI